MRRRNSIVGGKKPDRKRIFDLARWLGIALKPKHEDLFAKGRKMWYAATNPAFWHVHPKTQRNSFKRFWRASPYRQSKQDRRPRSARRASAKALWKALR